MATGHASLRIAWALRVVTTARAVGPFGGGQEVAFGFGQVESLKLAEVTLKQVPVMILPTRRFSQIYQEKGFVLGGAVGTALLRQFLATVDYKQGRLVLRERSAASRERWREREGWKALIELPFVLDYPHLMLARGSLNGRDGLTAFVDSGLALEARFTSPIQTLEYLGIPAPERLSTNPIGGSGGVWKSDFFEVDSIGLGPLVQQHARGEFGAFPPALAWSRGYLQDFLISHRFLREYTAWTLDFDRRLYLFER